jgi:hypothetical protein
MKSLFCYLRVATAMSLAPGASALTQEPPTLKLVRDLRIDAAGNDLSPINFLAVAPNGTIIVTQQQDRNLRYFDASGNSLGTFGRQGQGPGEFMNVGRTMWIADTLAVYDGMNRRLTLISPDRKFIRTVSLQVTISLRPKPGVDTPAQFSAQPLSLAADGSMIVSPFIREGTPVADWPGGVKEGSPLVRADASGVVQNVVAWRPEIDCSIPFDAGAGMGSGFVAIPFCANLQFDYAADGARVALSWVEPGARPQFRVAAFRANGDTLFNRIYAYQLARIPKAEKDSVVAARSRNPQMRAALEKAQLPDNYPPLSRVMLGADETTWLELTTREGERTWQMLDARGTQAAQLKVPRNLRIMVATRSTIWATETDDDGLQHVVRFRLIR